MTEFNDDVIDQLAVIRKNGHCNMLDRACVEDVASQIGFEQLTAFLEEADSEAYMEHLEEMGSRV